MKQMYYCELCGKPYESQEECQRCESFHIGPKCIDAGMFLAIDDAKSPYIENLIMRMEDGALVRYVYDSVVDDSQVSKNGESEA